MRLLHLQWDTYNYWHSSIDKHQEAHAKLEKLPLTLQERFTLVEWQTEWHSEYQYAFDGFPDFVTEEEVTELLLAGFSFKVLRTQEINAPGEKLFQAKEPTAPCEDNFNHRLEVHMPGQALSLYNETLLMEDGCTDALQSYLSEGWRIIAALPQPDQRRPDYVLGRYNPASVGTRAERG